LLSYYLFIGVGIQPAFTIEITNSRPIENTEDCNCRATDDYDIVRLERLFNRIDSLIDRVETCTKLISLMSKDKPEVIEDCEEISDEIKDLSMIVDELNIALSGQDNTIICAILEAMLNVTLKIWIVGYNVLNLSYIIIHKIRIIANFLIILDGCLSFTMILTSLIIIQLQENYDCIEYPIGSQKILYQETREIKTKNTLN